MAAFSARARDGAPVSTPLGWAELGRRRPLFTVRTVLGRLGRLRSDPWAGYWTSAQSVTGDAIAALRRLA